MPPIPLFFFFSVLSARPRVRTDENPVIYGRPIQWERRCRSLDLVAASLPLPPVESDPRFPSFGVFLLLLFFFFLRSRGVSFLPGDRRRWRAAGNSAPVLNDKSHITSDLISILLFSLSAHIFARLPIVFHCRIRASLLRRIDRTENGKTQLWPEMIGSRHYLPRGKLFHLFNFRFVPLVDR